MQGDEITDSSLSAPRRHIQSACAQLHLATAHTTTTIVPTTTTAAAITLACQPRYAFRDKAPRKFSSLRTRQKWRADSCHTNSAKLQHAFCSV
jgi:hypothetical protein